MPGEKGSEASSQPLLAEPVADMSKVTAQVARERMTEMIRLVREAGKTPRAKASDGASSRAPGEIPKRTVGENDDPAPACSSEAFASAPAESAKRVAEETGGWTGICNQLAGPREAMAEQSAERGNAVATEISSPAPPHSADAIAKLPAAVRETTDDEAVGSPEALPEESEEVEQTVTDEIGSRVPVVRWTYRSAKLPAEIRKTASAERHSASRLPSREAITDEARPQALAQTSPDRPAPWEIERQLELAGLLQPTAAQTLARWRDALWEALHGRWSEAGWEFARGVFHLLTQGATWRRVGKAVLHFLARFIPGREPEVLRRSREIKELFRDLHEEPKKPGTWSNCPR